MYVLYVVIGVAVIGGLVKFWPLIAMKIPKGGKSGDMSMGGSSGGLSEGLAAPDSGSSIYG